MYGIFIKSAANPFMKLAGDPKYVGSKIILLCVLHTWTRAMVYHPHVHCLVLGGGITPYGLAWAFCQKIFPRSRADALGNLPHQIHENGPKGPS